MKRLLVLAIVGASLVVAPVAHAAPGDIYTYDPMSKPGSLPRIFKVNPATGAQTKVSEGGLFDPNQAYGLAYEPSGTLLVANGANDNIIRVDKTTGAQSILTPGVASARGVVVDTNGDIYATDSATSTVYKINPNTGAKTPLHTGAPLATLRGIAIGANGLLYLNTPTQVFSMTKSVSVPTPVTSNGNLTNAQDIVGAPDGNLYVSDFNPGKLIRVTPAGGQSVAASGPPLDTLNAVALDANGKVLISDQAAFGSGAIFRFDGAPTAVTVSSADQFEDPRGMAAEPNAPAGAPPTTPPADKAIDATFSSKKKQRLKSKAITVNVSCPKEACTVQASGNVSVPKISKSYKLKKVTKTLKAGEKGKLKLKLSKKLVKAAKRALKKHKKVTAKIKVTATDAAKNASTKSLKVKLKR